MHEEPITLTLSHLAAVMMLELVQQLQIAATDPNLIATATAIAEVRDQLTAALPQEPLHVH